MDARVDCPSELEIIVAALRGELPLHDRGSREQRARIREVVDADLARVERLAAANTDADSALYYERTRARLRQALTLAAGPDACRVPGGVAKGAERARGRATSKPVRTGAADSARVRVQTQAAGAALLGAA